MIMVAHQAVAMDYRPVAATSGFKIFTKFLAIPAALENLLLFVSARRHMVKCYRILNP